VEEKLKMAREPKSGESKLLSNMSGGAPVGLEAKRKSLDEAVLRMEKTFGKGAIMRLGERSHIQVETIPTGSLALDLALGGGLPRGRLVEIFGAEGGGKTTLTLQCIAEAQKAGGLCAFIDAEHALNPSYARALGVDVDNLYIAQPDNGEQALEIADTLMRSSAIDCLVIDSVAALTPRAEVEGEMGDLLVGAMARMMSQGCRKLASTVSRSNSVAIFINQIREKIGVMYGSPETTPGGRALKFFASVRMRVSRGEAIKNGTEQIGNRTKVSIIKNKVAPPFREAEFDLIYGQGISKYGDILDLAVKQDLIQKGGAWFTLGEERFQGRDNVRAFLEQNPSISDQLESQIREAYGFNSNGAPPEKAAVQADEDEE
jgi:recombination protein RecA